MLGCTKRTVTRRNAILPSVTTVLAILFFAAFFLITLARPRWGVLMVLALLPSYLWRFEVAQLPTTVLEVLLLIVFAAWFLRVIFQRNGAAGSIRERFTTIGRVLHHSGFLFPIVLFFFASIVAMFVAPDLRAALGLWRAYVLEPLLFLIVFIDAFRTETEAGARGAFWALGLSAISIAAGSFIQVFTGYGLLPGYDGIHGELRFTSFFEFPAAVGLFLTPVVLIFFGKLLPKGSTLSARYRASAWIVVLLSLTAIILSRAEGAYAGVAVGVLFLLWFRWTWKPFAVVAALSLLLFAVPSVRERVVPILTLQDASGGVRRALWEGSLNLLVARPLQGAGFSGFARLYDQYRLPQHVEILNYPHSLFLNFWAETTVFGALAVLWLLLMFTSLAERAIRHGSPETRSWFLALSAALIGVVVYGSVDVPFFKNDLAVLWWVPFVLAVVLGQALPKQDIQRLGFFGRERIANQKKKPS